MDPDIQFTKWIFNKGVKRKLKPEPEVIDLNSDSDVEIVDVQPSKQDKKTNRCSSNKKSRTIKIESRSHANSQSSSSHVLEAYIKEDPDFEKETESDYENIPGYEMCREEYLTPINASKVQDITAELEAALKKLSLGRVQVVSNSGFHPPFGKKNSVLESKEYRGIRGYHKTGPVAPSYHRYRSRTGGPLRFLRNEFYAPLKHLSPQCSFRMADACTWVCQTGERLLVSSGTPGGGENEGERNLYNEGNTLAYFQRGFESPEYLPSHYLRGNDPGGDGGPDAKYFDVDRACFDPSEPNVFVSAGRDGVLTIWNYTTMKVKDLYSNSDETKLAYIPVRRFGRETYKGSFVHDVVFRKNRLNSGKSIFSTPCRNGTLFIHSYSYDGDQSHDYSRQTLLNKQTFCRIGATLWGDYASSNELFTCAEAQRTSLTNVCHHVYDVQSGKSSYTLDKRQNGEEICLNPEGSTLALFTQRGDILDLNLYDTRRKDGHSIAHVRDIPCENEEPDITKAAWSPDGIFLAVATNDHRIRIYDGRFLNSAGKPVMEFFHDVQIEQSFSVTFMEWTTNFFLAGAGQNVGLVTGNSGDNRILLWDTRYSNQEPKVLAELCSQVSVGCLGDPYKREKPLIIGGLDGWVHAYDTSGHVF